MDWSATASLPRGLRDVRPEIRLVGSAIRAFPVARNFRERRSRRDRLRGQPPRLLEDEIAATTDEPPLRAGGDRRRQRPIASGAGDLGRLHGVADREDAALQRPEVDPGGLVAERGAQRAGDVEIAAAGDGIDVGRAATPVASIDAEGDAADAKVRADPVEFAPRPKTIDIDVGAKAERIDLIAPLRLEASNRRQVDQRNQVFRLVHEMSVLRAHEPRRLPQSGNLLAEERLDGRAAVPLAEVRDQQALLLTLDGEAQCLRIDMGDNL